MTENEEPRRPRVSEQSDASEEISVGDLEVWPSERLSPEPTSVRTPLSPPVIEGMDPFTPMRLVSMMLENLSLGTRVLGDVCLCVCTRAGMGDCESYKT